MGPRLRIATVASLSTVALMVGTTATAYADANPFNRGHHYGQLKHPKAQPPPTPPTPAPTPNTGGQPASGPTPTVHQSVANTVTTPASLAISTAVAPSASPVASGIIEPVAALPGVAGNEDDWLLLLILPALMAVWLIAAIGLARRLSRIGKTRSLQVQTAPA